MKTLLHVSDWMRAHFVAVAAALVALVLAGGNAFATDPTIDWAAAITGAKTELLGALSTGVAPILIVLAVVAGFGLIYRKVKQAMQSS